MRIQWCLLGSLALVAFGCGASGDDDDDGSACTAPCTTGMNGVTGMGTGGAPVTTGSGGMHAPGGSGGTQAMPGGTGGSGMVGNPMMMGGGTGGKGGGDTMMSGSTGGSGGDGNMMGGGTGGMTGAAGNPAPSGMGCAPMPAGMVDTMVVTGTGPDGNYTIFRPATLGEGGILHPPVAWGNGLATTPDLYTEWLTNVAANGFVVIANPGTGSDPMVVRQGLEWLLAQNDSGDYAGKLAVDCAATIGYSMGGGAAVGAGSHPAVKAVVSVHGLQDASEAVSGPLLLTTSDNDGFVTPSGFVQPCYDRSSVQPTIMATYITGQAASFDGHLTPIGNGGQDAEPTIQWLRYWLYGDQAAKVWFFGDDCTLCKMPWGMIQKKNYDWN
jgi:hypothetical protein